MNDLSFKYRPHRGSLYDSLAETVEIKDLIAHLSKELDISLTDSDVKVIDQGYDNRCDWQSGLVTVRNVQNIFGKDMGSDYYGAVGHIGLNDCKSELT